VSKQGSGVSDTTRRSLEVTCSISGKDPTASLAISFRTRIEDITQRLGGLELLQTADTDDVDLFGWTSQVIDQRDKFEDDFLAYRQKASKSNETIDSLEHQLEELIKAKEEHETELLSKFAALLNEKKLRLRNLERNMSTSKADKRALDQLEQSLPESTEDEPRGKKRSARNAKTASESDESDGFEAMDVDKPESADSDEDDNQTTDRGSETESEADDDLDQPVTSQTEGASTGASKLPQKHQSDQSLPPTRHLPFTQAAQKNKEDEPVPVDDEETETEDDEL
jgi:hypothetical protein